MIKLGRIKFNVKDYRTKFCGNSCKKDPCGENNQDGAREEFKDGNIEGSNLINETPNKQMIRDQSHDSLL